MSLFLDSSVFQSVFVRPVDQNLTMASCPSSPNGWLLERPFLKWKHDELFEFNIISDKHINSENDIME